MANILILDVETAPNVAYVWRFFKENIGAKQVLENGYILSYAAKWLGKDRIYYEDLSNQHEKSMLVKLAALLDEADVVIAHNGDQFDIPQIQGRFLQHGINPPSPYKQIDTRKVAKKEFYFPSNSLEYLCKVLNVPVKKGQHKNYPGFELWLGVLRNEPEAWAEMKEYNIDDILALEGIYLRMRPFMRLHPNLNVYHDHSTVHCPKCNSDNVQWRGYAHTSVGRYHRFQCNDCGGWGRSRTNILPKDVGKKIAVNVVN